MHKLSQLFHKITPKPLKRIIASSDFDIAKFVRNASVEMSEGALVLDAGAGQCQYKGLFSKQKYVGVDAAYGDSKWDYSHLDHVCDLTKMPFSNEHFDHAVCTQVLEHVPYPQNVLNEIGRVLKKDGTLYLSAPQGWCEHQKPHDYFRYTRFGLEILLRNAGFEIESIEPAGGYFKYLGNRITYLPKAIFWNIRHLFFRIIFLPIEIVISLICFLILPIVFNLIDFLDTKKDYTLNYLVKARKK